MYRTLHPISTFAKVLFCPFFRNLPQILPSVFFGEPGDSISRLVVRKFGDARRANKKTGSP